MKIPASIPVWFREVFINGVVGARWYPRGLRWMTLKLIGIDTQRVMFGSGVVFAGRNIKIGSMSSINEDVFLGAHGQITIGDYVAIAARTVIVTATHEISNVLLRCGELEYRPVTIGNGAWIGAAAVILPGVTIGEGAIVAAGSVVVKDCEPNAVYAGNPARLIRHLEPLRPE